MTETISITITSNDVLEANTKKIAIQKIAKLDSKTLKNLSEVTESEKAINKFNSNIGFIKTFMK
jgi:hypothetical protein